MPRFAYNMEDEYNTEFQQKLLSINEKLGPEEIEALKFLCSDLISPKDSDDINSAYKLFQKLMIEELLSKKDSFLVAELLFLIKHNSLLREIGYTKKKVLEELPIKGVISSYRVMLYNLSEEITKEDFEHIKFLMQKEIPKTIKSFLSLLKYMEKKDHLSEDNMEILVDICKPISKDLIKRIQQYKEERKEKSLSVAPPMPESFLNTSANMEEEVCYRMECLYRGHCIIFNNFKFPKMPYREGSSKDADELKSVFEWLGFKGTIHKNKTKEEMEEILMLCRTSPEHYDSDCFVCCVLTHGDSGSVYSSDEKSLDIHELTSYFTADQCQGLANKPKLFFIQACQGTHMQEGVPLETDAKNVTYVPPVLKKTSLKLIPKEADFLLGMATVDGCYAIRHRVNGSWYIQSLCHQLKCLVPRQRDILSILTAVNNEVSQQSDAKGEKKQMPQPAFTLRKKVIFPVPLDPPPTEEHFPTP